LFVLSMAGDRLLVAGSGTAADGIIKMAGAVNAITGYDGYKAVNDEAIIGARPDVILVMKRGEHTMKAETVFAHPAFKMTPAAAKQALVSFEGLYLLGFGPRTASAARDLAREVYPQLAAANSGTQAGTSGAAECRG
jgi:iron complex transport system substrate-binding protein